MIRRIYNFLISLLLISHIDSFYSSTTINPFITQNAQEILFDQCPCFKTPSGYNCIQYDTRYQATSLEEAMVTFEDLTFDIDEETPEMMSSNFVSECHTADCVKCQEDIKMRLSEIGMIPNTTMSINNDSNLNVTCQRYRFTKNSSLEYKYGEKKGEEKEEDKEKCDDSSSEDNDDDSKKEKKKCKKNKKRSRRQITTQSNVSMIGSRYNISCTQKGIDLDGTGLVSLCNKCWSWRRLPSNYYPQYVNELVCDSLNTECLSGFGGCSVGTRSIEVYRMDINQTVTLTAGAFCECKIFTNSALLNLVNGTSQEGQTILNNLG
uniref:DUF281 domain-containing protein n=1 Tax=Strongyloides venezuelensis TaxID=75913 RepID=A0A0K0FMV2_STRVS